MRKIPLSLVLTQVKAWLAIKIMSTVHTLSLAIQLVRTSTVRKILPLVLVRAVTSRAITISPLALARAHISGIKLLVPRRIL